MNWLKKYEENNNYYQKNDKITDLSIKNLLEENKKIFTDFIKSLNPDINKLWLDLGCGKCKYYDDIKIYNPKKYFGIDFDIKNIIKTYKKYNEDQILELYNCDLSKDWLDTEYKINNLTFTSKYDYVICNFSLMHFCNDLFWTQLNNLVKKGTIFIFNLTSENVYWNFNDNYLKSNSNYTEVYLEWLHNSPVREPLISKELIKEYINKYEWEIQSIKKININYLISCYDWYTIIKK
jgi:SAM-dependent methyltransferase